LSNVHGSTVQLKTRDPRRRAPLQEAWSPHAQAWSVQNRRESRGRAEGEQVVAGDEETDEDGGIEEEKNDYTRKSWTKSWRKSWRES